AGEKRQRARSGPPWCSRSRCPSPSSPSGVTRAAATGSLGTPPGEILIWTTLPFTLTGDPPGSGRRGGPPDHALDHGLQDELAALVDEGADVRFRHRAAPRLVGGAGGVLLVSQSVRSHRAPLW